MQTTTIASLFDQIAWTTPADADLTGYQMDAYFDGDVHAEHPTREFAIAAARAAYRGPDSHGVGLAFSSVAPSLDGEGAGHAVVGGPVP